MRSKFKYLALLGLLSLVLTFGTGCTRIEPGWGGIVVNLNGPDRGVEEIEVQTGRIFYWPFGTAVYQLPHFMQRVAWTKNPAEGSRNNEEITFNSVEGTTIWSDIGLAWSVKKGRIPYVFVAFRTNVETITDDYFRAQARAKIGECAETLPLDEIYGAKKTAIANCGYNKLLEVSFIADNFDLEYLNFIGAFRYEPKVQESISNKIAAENQAKAVEKAAAGKANAIRLVATADKDAKFLDRKSVV